MILSANDRPRRRPNGDAVLPQGAAGLRTRFWLPATLVFVLLGPLLGVVAWRLARDHERTRVEAKFDEHLADRAHALENEILAYVEALHSVRAFFYSSVKVTRGEFATFTKDARERHPAIQAMEWVPRVTAEERDRHEAEVRADSLPGYRIRERLGHGGLVPAGPREVYYPVCYVEPLEGNESALGFDLNSDAVRRAALHQAVASDRAAMSDPVALVQEKASSAGLLLVLAVYADPEDERPAAERAVEGLVLIVFRIEEVLRQTLAGVSGQAASDMHYELFDPDADGTPRALARSEASCLSCHEAAPAGVGDEASHGTARQWIEVAQQRWQLRARPTDAFLDAHEGSGPLLLGLVVFLAWEVVSGLLFVLVRSGHTLVVRRQADVVRSVLRNLSEGVVVADRTGEIQFANDAAARLLGREQSEEVATRWSTENGFYLADGETPCPSDQLPLARAVRGETVSGEQIRVSGPTLDQSAWLTVSGSPLLDENGTTQGGVVVMRDITTRKRSEEEVQRLSSAVEQAADAIFITDREGRILYANPAFETITGYSRRRALGDTPRLLKSGVHDRAYYESMWNTLLQGQAFQNTVINRKRNGDLFHAEQTITPMTNAAGRVTHFVAVLRDQTERRRIHEQEVEMQLAADVQQRLYPSRAPQVPGLEVAGAVSPAEATCGDYYDYISMPDEALGLAVGDVCGHGLGPAIVMSQTRAYVRSLAKVSLDPGEILQEANAFLARDTADDLFVTLFLATVDVRTRRLVYANAGHTPGYVLDAHGRVRAELKATGGPLGLFEESTFSSDGGLTLEPGDVIVLLTDGATESRNADGEMFGEERVLEVVRAHQSESAQAILDHLRRAVSAFTGLPRPRDDVTFVIAKATRT